MKRRGRSGTPAVALAAALVLAFGGFGFAGIAAAQVGDSVSVELAEQNGSGLSGNATLTARGDQTVVVVNAPGAPEGTTGHMFDSTCDDHASATVFYDLTPLDADGGSETVVDQTFANLTTGKYWIHLHKPGVERGGGLLCGNVPDARAATTVPNTGVGTSREYARSAGALLAGLIAASLLAVAAFFVRTRRGLSGIPD